MTVEDGRLRFVANRVERRRGGSDWSCQLDDIGAIGVRRRLWLDVETAREHETFRIFGAAATAAAITAAMSSARAEIGGS